MEKKKYYKIGQFHGNYIFINISEGYGDSYKDILIEEAKLFLERAFKQDNFFTELKELLKDYLPHKEQ